MTVRTTVLLAGSAILLAVLLGWSVIALDAAGVWFAFLVVWLPMAWLGTISRQTSLARRRQLGRRTKSNTRRRQELRKFPV